MDGWIIINKKTRESKGVIESAILNQGCLIVHLSEENAEKWFILGIADSRKKEYTIVKIQVFSE